MSARDQRQLGQLLMRLDTADERRGPEPPAAPSQPEQRPADHPSDQQPGDQQPGRPQPTYQPGGTTPYARPRRRRRVRRPWGIGHALIQFALRALDARGRSSRPEFWWTALIAVPGIAMLAAVAFSVFTPLTPDLARGVLIAGVLLGVPVISVTMRRLNDCGVNTGLVGLHIVPGLGTLAVLILCALPTRQTS